MPTTKPMKLDRTVVHRGKMQELQDDGFIDATMQQRIGMVWDITISLWTVSTRGGINAQSRLQRDVAMFSSGKN